MFQNHHLIPFLLFYFMMIEIYIIITINNIGIVNEKVDIQEYWDTNNKWLIVGNI